MDRTVIRGIRSEEIPLLNDFLYEAVWTRIMNDYGHIADGIPSMAISLYKDYRHQGIGTELLREMLQLLRRDAL